MAEAATKLPIESQRVRPPLAEPAGMEGFGNEMERLFDSFGFRSGGRVTLQGKASAWHERVLAERAAWASPGVNSVEDHLALA